MYYFFLDEIFYHFQKSHGPRTSRTFADQGPHSVHLLNVRFLVDLVVQLVMMSGVVLYVDVKCVVKSCETQVVHVGNTKFV